MKVLKNPQNGAPIRHVVNHKEYSLEVGDMAAFEDDVAAALLYVYGFLEEVKVEQNVAGKFKCPYCEFTSDYKLGVVGHLRSHKDKPKSDPVVVPGQIEVTKVAEGKPIVSLEEKKRQKEQSFYEEAGIKASGVKDNEGVEWTGPGLETDNPADK